MLKVNHIDVSYGDVQVLWDVSFEVREKEILVLVGANGAGKSTTLRTISGLLRPSKGSLEFKGTRLNQVPAHKMIELGHCPCPGRPPSFSGNDRGGKSDHGVPESQGQGQTPARPSRRSIAFSPAWRNGANSSPGP